VKKPDRPDAIFGNRIYRARDQYRDKKLYSPYSVRIYDELEMAKFALEHTKNAVRILKSITHKNVELQRLLNLVQFLACCHQTAIHFQKFYLLRGKMLTSSTVAQVNKQALAIERLAQKERKNVMAAIVLVRKDSSLGYEPSMDYACDEEALLWKLKQLDYMVKVELKPYMP